MLRFKFGNTPCVDTFYDFVSRLWDSDGKSYRLLEKNLDSNYTYETILETKQRITTPIIY